MYKLHNVRTVNNDKNYVVLYLVLKELKNRTQVRTKCNDIAFNLYLNDKQYYLNASFDKLKKKLVNSE